MRLINNSTRIAMAIIIALSASSVFAKDLVSTQEILQINGVRSWEAEARCDDIVEPLPLSRGAGSDEWCSRDYPDICSDDRVKTGLAVCQQARSEKAMADQAELDKAAAIASRPALLQEKMDIEAKLIALQQQRINLQRKELELQKGQVGNP